MHHLEGWKTQSNRASITHPWVISFSGERMWWTHAYIFMLLLVTVHTDACANTIVLTILSSLAQTYTCTHTNSKASQSINIFMLQTFPFQVNHPLFILCQYASFPTPTPSPSLACFVPFSVLQVIPPYSQTSIVITSLPANFLL